MPGDRVVPTRPGPWWASRRGCVLRVRYVEALITGRPGEYAYYDCATCLPVEDEQFAWLAPVTPHDEVERLRAEVARLTALVDQRPRPRLSWACSEPSEGIYIATFGDTGVAYRAVSGRSVAEAASARATADGFDVDPLPEIPR